MEVTQNLSGKECSHNATTEADPALMVGVKNAITYQNVVAGWDGPQAPQMNMKKTI